MKKLILSVIILYLLFNKSASPPLSSFQSPQVYDLIKGRDYVSKRFNVYRSRPSSNWIKRDALPDESLKDTTKPLCDYFIQDENGVIHITIHNFPSDAVEDRIPPSAQIARWKNQFETLIPEESTVIPQAFNGYTGMKFKGVGSLNHSSTMMLAWILQVGKEHYQMLSSADHTQYREMRADVAIKAVGPRELMELNEEEISRFARSFELIEEIPTRS